LVKFFPDSNGRPVTQGGFFVPVLPARVRNGRWRTFSPEARHFWRLHGGLILSLLRPETALTFAELRGFLLATGRRAGAERGSVAGGAIVAEEVKGGVDVWLTGPMTTN